MPVGVVITVLIFGIRKFGHRELKSLMEVAQLVRDIGRQPSLSDFKTHALSTAWSCQVVTIPINLPLIREV